MRAEILFAVLGLVVSTPGFGGEAIQTLEAGSTVGVPPDVARLVSEGAAGLQSGDFKIALKRFQEADKLAGGRSWDAAAGAAAASLQLGKESKALDFADRMLDIDQAPERRGIALQLMGSCFARNKRLDEAEDAFREALDLLPGRPLQTRIALAGVLCNRWKEMEALYYLDEAGLCAQKHAGITEGVAPGDPIRFEVGGPVTEPVKLSGDFPRYPETARRSRIEGRVVMGTIIGADGEIKCLRVLEGLSHGLNCEAALSLINWKFSPSTLEGEPIDVYYVLTIRFGIR